MKNRIRLVRVEKGLLKLQLRNNSGVWETVNISDLKVVDTENDE